MMKFRCPSFGLYSLKKKLLQTIFARAMPNKHAFLTFGLPSKVHFTDWLPTLFKLAGGDLAQLGDIDGIDQLPVIRFKQGRQGSL